MHFVSAMTFALVVPTTFGIDFYQDIIYSFVVDISMPRIVFIESFNLDEPVSGLIVFCFILLCTVLLQTGSSKKYLKSVIFLLAFFPSV